MSNSRRNFIGHLTTSAALIKILESYGAAAHVASSSGYKLKILATNWGFSGSWNDFGSKVAAEGFDGVEVWAPLDSADRKEFMSAMNNHQLEYGLLIGGNDRNPAIHLDQFQMALEVALSMKPLYINCHSGRDWFTLENNLKIINTSYRLAAGSGITVCHETHRGRMLYSAPVTQEFINRSPDLKITADLSHWCVVHESLLEDQVDALSLVLSRAEHIHARIGHSEGPQVNDPRAPEWEKALAAHLSWWDNIVARKKKEGKVMTVLTEFGPADYMPTTPFTRQPLADQWKINVHMKDLLRRRYS